MRFRTEVKLPPTSFRLTPDSRLLFVGSCFAEHIGERMSRCLPAGRVGLNPRGVVYNPESMGQVVDGLLAQEKQVDEELCFEAGDGLWHHWLYSTRFTARTKEALVECLEQEETVARRLMVQADALCLTFSTDHCYLLADGAGQGRVVANCHKQPARCFTEHTPDLGQMIADWTQRIQRLLEAYPRLHVVLTLSPYRYAKYGMHESALAKARLLLLIDALCRVDERVSYFPAYEIVCDELRDYRFYEADMLHPSAQAVDYVWERFREWTFSPELADFAADYERLQRDLAHRPLKPESEEYQRFKQRLEERCRQFETKWKHPAPGQTDRL